MGFQYLMKANIDPRGMVAFFEKIQKEQDESGAPDIDGALSMLSTHPATKERIANLNALIENEAGSGDEENQNILDDEASSTSDEEENTNRCRESFQSYLGVVLAVSMILTGVLVLVVLMNWTGI